MKISVNYVVRPHVAYELWDKHDIKGDDLGYVGILGHKKYNSVLDDPNVIEEVWSATATPIGIAAPSGDDVKFASIVRAHVSLLTGGREVKTEIQHYIGFVVIYPSVDDDYIYASNAETTMYDINLLEYVDYSLLTTNPLGMNACEEGECMFGVKEMDGLIVYDSVMSDFVSEQEMDSRLTGVMSAIRRYEIRGAVVFNVLSDARHALITELTHAWSFPRRESPVRLIYMTEGSRLEGMSSGVFGRWLERSVRRLLLDLPPLVRISRSDIMDMEDRGEALLLLKYLCVRSLRQSCTVNYEKCVNELVVLPSAVAVVPVWGPDELDAFEKVFNSIGLKDLHIHYSFTDGSVGIIVDGVLVNTSSSPNGEVVQPLPDVRSVVSRTTDWGSYLASKHQIESVIEEMYK